jgi:hypothetical protein
MGEDAQRSSKRGNDQMIKDDLYHAVPGQIRSEDRWYSGQASGAGGLFKLMSFHDDGQLCTRRADVAFATTWGCSSVWSVSDCSRSEC